MQVEQRIQLVTGQAHDHTLCGDALEHRIQHRQLLGLAQRGGFAGGAADHQTRDTVLQQPGCQAVEAGEIDLAVTKGGDQRHPDTLKSGHAKTPCD